MEGSLNIQQMPFHHAMAAVPVLENHSFFQLEDKRFLALPELEASMLPLYH